MKYRKLRIAWSIGWGIVCLLLIALWVRSYSYLDTFGTPPDFFTSWRGRLFTGGTIFATNTPDGEEASGSTLHVVLGTLILTTVDQGNISYDGGSSLPIAALLLLTGIVAGAPWIRWRFSLRTLLIATALVAAGLGLAVYAAR